MLFIISIRIEKFSELAAKTSARGSQYCDKARTTNPPEQNHPGKIKS